ncbi:MAG: nitrilase-related carbon-nitrogen hydrolase, partial [Nitrospirota bacterium]
MRVGFYQFDSQFGAVAKNLETVTAKLDQADADLIVLPELFASGYQFLSQQEAYQLAEPVPDGPTVRCLVDI